MVQSDSPHLHHSFSPDILTWIYPFRHILFKIFIIYISRNPNDCFFDSYADVIYDIAYHERGVI